jgi:hypothetical protein
MTTYNQHNQALKKEDYENYMLNKRKMSAVARGSDFFQNAQADSDDSPSLRRNSGLGVKLTTPLSAEFTNEWI